MTNSITVQVIHGSDIVDERAVPTPAGARRSLLAAIERHADVDGGWDDVCRQAASSEAARWDGRSDFKVIVPKWNRTPGSSLIFHAQP